MADLCQLLHGWFYPVSIVVREMYKRSHRFAAWVLLGECMRSSEPKARLLDDPNSWHRQ
jgi:hypothetical protein